MLKYMILMAAVAVSFVSCADEEPTGPDITPPDSVTNFRALREGTGDMLIQLAWDKNSESDLAGYLLYRLQDDEINYVFLDSVSENSYFDTVSSYSSVYSYEIKAYDEAGNVSEGNKNAYKISSPNMFAPVAVDSVDVTAKNRGLNKFCEVVWYSPDVDIKSFNILKETATTKELLVVAGTETSYMDTAVTATEIYKYSIQGVDFGDREGLVGRIVSDVVLEKPTLVYPNSDTVIATPVVNFTWNQVANVTEYEFILNQGKDLVDTLITPVVGTTVSLSLDLSTVEGLEPGIKLNWDVLTYSKVDGEINSSAEEKAMFTYIK